MHALSVAAVTWTMPPHSTFEGVTQSSHKRLKNPVNAIGHDDNDDEDDEDSEDSIFPVEEPSSLSAQSKGSAAITIFKPGGRMPCSEVRGERRLPALFSALARSAQAAKCLPPTSRSSDDGDADNRNGPAATFSDGPSHRHSAPRT
jgi:hypothetical protein